MSLVADAVGVRLGGRAILDRVCLTLSPGAFVGLVGPNGAGKTTLMRTLAGLIAPETGDVRLDDRPLSEVPRDLRARRIAALFPGSGIGWPMRVREVVALGRAPHIAAFQAPAPRDHAAVRRAMERADVAHLADRAADTLSAGERMRVLLARALAVESRWLLADEPTTALDPGHQLDAMELLRGVSRDGTGVVAVLHDLTLAARFCDRIVVLDRGRVASDERPGAALGDGLLRDVFGIRVERAACADGTRYILPWSRSGPQQRRDDPP